MPIDSWSTFWLSRFEINHHRLKSDSNKFLGELTFQDDFAAATRARREDGFPNMDRQVIMLHKVSMQALHSQIPRASRQSSGQAVAIPKTLAAKVTTSRYPTLVSLAVLPELRGKADAHESPRKSRTKTHTRLCPSPAVTATL